MHADAWTRVRALFEDALDLVADEREAWVRRACGDDEALAAEVLALLRTDARQETALPLIDGRAEAWLGAQPLAGADLTGTTIEGFRIVRRIGEGGMGTVYLAEQQRPHRQVALKTLALRLPSERARRRFEDEADILARLRHPAIAQVLEAGSARVGEADVPWFAMELVEDPRTIDRFARELALDARAIAALFKTVCDAVHYAHQRGVIHRDLKPANVLVDRHGHAKVIDFGIARLADGEPASRRTRTGEILGTLAYMSPERLEEASDGADTASDVYALGVMLYELLARQSPFAVDGLAPARVVDLLRTADPAPPSRVARGVPIELDWITLKAMARERSRRYASAGEMARDLERCLRNEALVAGPPSTTYRLRKLAWRHRLLVAGAAVVFLAVSIGLVVAALGWQRVAAAERLAGRRATTLAEVNGFHERILRGAYGSEKGSDVRLADVVDAAARDLDGTRFDDPLVEAGARNALGASYLGLGRAHDAARELQRARVVLDEHGVDQLEGLRIAVKSNLGKCYDMLGKADLAEQEARAALVDRLALHAEDHAEIAIARCNLAALLLKRAAFPAALELATQAHRAFAQRYGEAREQTINARGMMAQALSGLGRDGEAEREFDAACELADRHLHPDHPARLAILTGRTGLYHRHGRKQEHLRAAEEIAAIRERVAGPTHPQTLEAWNNLAAAQAELGQYVDAEATFRRVAAAWEARGMREGFDWIAAGQNLTVTVRRQGRAAEAEPMARALRATAERSLAKDHWLLGVVTKELGGCLRDLGRLEEAEVALLAAHDLLARALQPSDYRVQKVIGELVALYEGWQRPAEVERWRARQTKG